MAEQLSQADIDALLDTFTTPEGGASEFVSAAAGSGKRQKRPVETQAYDFSHPDLLSRDQVRSVRTVHEGFAQALAKRLSTELLTNVSASVASIDHLTYAEFLMLLPSPTVLSVVEIPQLSGNIAIEINPAIAFAFIDRLLGGEGRPLGKTRPLTAIEQGLMERVVEKCCQELAGVWNPLFEMDFQLQAIEGNPELARVIGPNEMVVLVSMELRMNEVSGVMTLCLPYIVMEPAIQRLSQSNMVTRKGGGDPERLRSALSRSVRDSRVRVDVEIGRACLSIRELMELEPGDVLRFSAPCRAGATLLIEGVTRAEGSPGRANGNLALRVDSARDRGQEEKG
ncbi:MAG: flagellar motor switch protein FliM [bacterium]